MRIKVGEIVQNNSKDWDSIVNLSRRGLKMVVIILKVTIVVIRAKIVIVWSWKKINCSINDEEAFWKLIADQVEISKRNLFIFGA